MQIRDLKAGSVFKMMFLSIATTMLVLALLFGVMAMFGANTVNANGRPVHGIAALPISLLLSGLVSLLFSVLGFVGFLVLRTLFPGIRIHASPPVDPDVFR